MFAYSPKSYAAIAALSLLLTACGAAETTTDVDTTVEADTSENLSISLEELAKLGKNYTCTFSETDDTGNTTEGTVYIAGGDERMRGDFTIAMTNGENYDAHMIHVGTMNHIWTSQMEQGFMMEVTEENSIFGTDNDQEVAGMTSDEAVDFECDKWNVDEDLFEVPSTIEFVDMQAYMNSLMNGMNGMNVDANAQVEAGMKAAQCGACDSISDATAKAQCKTALGC